MTSLWLVFIPSLYSWWGKNRVSWAQLSDLCSFFSTFCYLCFSLSFSHTACTQISMHGFLFVLIFPSWDRNGCFSSFLVVRMQELLGEIWGGGSLAVFSRGRVRSVTPPGSSLEPLRQAHSTLATRTRFCPHAHTPTAGSRSKAARWRGVQGSVWDWGKLGALCQWGSYVQVRITRAVQPSTANYTGWAGRYLTTNTHTLTHTGTWNETPTATFTQHPSP